MIAVSIIAFIVGLAVGSFLNVVILRGARRENLGGRSHCDSCQKTLSFFELIPIISFFLQKGRCRHCGTALFWQYPLVEFITAFSYSTAATLLISYYPMASFSAFLSVIIAFIIIGAAIVIVFSDLKFRIIPMVPTIILAAAGILIRFSNSTNFLFDIVWSLVFAMLLAAIWFFSGGRAMGFGDAQLILATSLVLGFPASLIAFLFSFWIGAVVAFILIAAKKKTLRDTIPFGPSIIAGALIAYFFSNQFLALTGLGALW